MAEYTCAVWYRSWHYPDHELFEDEQSAARFAVRLEDAESGYVEGVQFSDGRVFKRDDWVAYKDEEKRQWKAMREQVAVEAQQPSTPKRSIRDPFGSEEVEIEADAPKWLGVR